MSDEWFRYSATQLAECLRQRQFSATELVEEYILRIQKYNPVLNALVSDRFSDALIEAEQADRMLAKGENRPFLGVPCTIKEAFMLRGMPNASGLCARRDIRSDKDAEPVHLLRKAGFIPLGVSNTSELCMWMESDNRLYGRTNNPYDLQRTSGGSSGGEGALVGAGLSPVGLGSDIGGSIRMPAFFNGVFGHKCSPGLISNQGQFPSAENEAQQYLCSGPLCRKAEDLFPVSTVLAGENGASLQKEEIDWESLSVLSIPDDGFVSVSPELKAIQQDVLQFCRSKGARTKEIRVSGLKNSLRIWSAMMEEAADTSFAEQLFEEQSYSLISEWCSLFLKRSPHTIPALGLATLENISSALPSARAHYILEGQKLRSIFDEMLEGNVIVLYPSHGTVVPKHGRSVLTPWRWVYTAIVNTLLLPATQVPLGINSAGLPLGLQVIAARGRDALTIAMASELEEGFGGWIPPVLSSP